VSDSYSADRSDVDASIAICRPFCFPPGRVGHGVDTTVWNHEMTFKILRELAKPDEHNLENYGVAASVEWWFSAVRVSVTRADKDV